MIARGLRITEFVRGPAIMVSGMLALAIALACVAGTAKAEPPARRPDVGEAITSRAFCVDARIVQRMTKVAAEDHNYTRSNQLLAAAKQGGFCIVMADPAPAVVLAIGDEVTFVDDENDKVGVSVVHVRVGKAEAWTWFLRKLGREASNPLVLAHGDAWWIQEGNYRSALDAHCCGEKDCVALPAGAVVITKSGWLVVETGEIFPEHGPGVHRSIDNQFWRCMYSDRTTRCLFVPFSGM